MAPRAAALRTYLCQSLCQSLWCNLPRIFPSGRCTLSTLSIIQDVLGGEEHNRDIVTIDIVTIDIVTIVIVIVQMSCHPVAGAPPQGAPVPGAAG